MEDGIKENSDVIFRGILRIELGLRNRASGTRIEETASLESPIIYSSAHPKV